MEWILRRLVYRPWPPRRGACLATAALGSPKNQNLKVTASLAALFLVALANVSTAVETLQTKAGDIYRVTTTSSFSGWNQIPPTDPQMEPKRVALSGRSKVVFRERALPSSRNSALRFLRVYETIDSSRKIGDVEEKASLRPAVRRILLDPEPGGYLIYSPDATLQFPELAMIDEHVHLPALEEFLPSGELTPGRTWEAPSAALAELTGVDAIESGQVTCKVEGAVPLGRKEYLQISATGTVMAKAGPMRVRCEIRGGVYVDPASGRLLSLRAIGRQETLGPNDTVTASLDVDYQVLAEPLAADPDLSDEVVSSIPSKPTEQSLLLTFESTSPQVRFDHHRRWILQRVEPGRIFFAGPDVSFVVTVEPEGKTPTADEYLKQVQTHLSEQKLDAKLVRPTRETKSEAGRIGNFRFETVLNNRESILDYWVIERGRLGATIAVNAAKAAPKELLAEVEAVVRGMSFDKSKPRP